MKSRIFLTIICVITLAFNALAKNSEYEKRCELVTKNNKELLKRLEKNYGLKSITPVLNENDNYTLLGYIGQKKAGKDETINTPYGESLPNRENMLHGFFSPSGSLVMPLQYAYIVPIYVDSEPMLRVSINTPHGTMKRGIFDLDNNAVVPLEYEDIYHYDARDTHRAGYTARSTAWYDVPKAPAYFEAFGHNGDTIYYYTPKGELKNKVGPGRRVIPGFTFVSKTINDIFTTEEARRKNRTTANIVSPRRKNDEIQYFGSVAVGKARQHPSDMGLIGPDGSVILDNKYRSIYIYATDSQYGECLPVCLYKGGPNDDCQTYGVINLLTGEEVLPYAFYRAWYDNSKGKWVVKRHKYAPDEIYEPGYDYVSNRYPDLGVQYYSEGENLKAVEYFAENGIDSPWAYIYSICAIYEVAAKNYHDYSGTEMTVSRNKTYQRVSFTVLPEFDFDTHINSLLTARIMINEYNDRYDKGLCTALDSLFYPDIAKFQKNIDGIIGKLEKSKALYPDLKAYSDMCENDLEGQLAQREKDKIEQKRIEEYWENMRKEKEREQKRMMEEKMFKNMVDGFLSILSTPITPSAPKHKQANRPAKGNASSGVSSSASSSSSNSGPTQAEINRATEIKRQISNLTDQIAHANSGSTDSAQKTMLINNNKRLIRELENELNDLRSKGVNVD